MIRKMFLTMSILTLGLFSAQAATVDGVVTATVGGAAIANAIVTLTPAGGGGTTYKDTTNATGHYSMTVTAGGYDISAAAFGYITSTAAFVGAGGGNVTQNITLAVKPAGIKITGTVTDSVSGTPLAGAIVRLQTTNGPNTTVVDSVITATNGTYTLDSVQAATYSIKVTASGHYANTETGINVTATITKNFKLVGLPVGSKISGTVTDSVSGSPLAGAVVRLRTANGGGFTVIDSVVTATNGTYTFDSVQAATYSINVTAALHNAKTETGIVANAATTEITTNFKLVGLPAGIKITGTVTDSVSGSPLSGAIVRLQTTNGPNTTVVDSVITATNGTYTFDSVQAATYSINVTATGHNAKTVTGIVAATTNIASNFQLTRLPGVTISGNVADSASGNPLSGAVVHLYQGSTLIDTAIVAVNGTYTLSNIQAGTYSITVTSAAHIHKTQSGIVVANTAITLDFLLVAGTDKVLSSGAKNIVQPNFTMSRSGIISLRNITENGILSITAINGKLVYRTSIAGNATSLKLPENIARTSGVFLVSITQKNLVIQKQWVK